MRFLETSKPRLFAHRGASGRRPENTLESFAAGLEAGAELLELDVHGTRDGEIVVRDMIYLALCLDHRIVDGAVGARFMNALISYLSEPSRIFLELA